MSDERRWAPAPILRFSLASRRESAETRGNPYPFSLPSVPAMLMCPGIGDLTAS